MSTFDGSKVNGLANALMNKLEQSENDDALDSISCFKYFKDRIPILLSRVDPTKLTSAITKSFDESFDYNAPIFAINSLVSYYSYDSENDTWETEARDDSFGLYYIPVYLVEPWAANMATVRVIIGNYIYRGLLSTTNDKIIVSDSQWGKICF